MDDRDDVLASAVRRARALAERDVQLLRSLLHPQLRWTTFRGDVLGLEAYVRGNTDGALRWHAQELVDADVVVHGDTAVLTAVAVDDVETDGRRETFRLRMTQTWVREGQRWLCLAGHAGPRLDAQE